MATAELNLGHPDILAQENLRSGSKSETDSSDTSDGDQSSMDEGRITRV